MNNTNFASLQSQLGRYFFDLLRLMAPRRFAAGELRIYMLGKNLYQSKSIDTIKIGGIK
jgi:hypothetical protein